MPPHPALAFRAALALRAVARLEQAVEQQQLVPAAEVGGVGAGQGDGPDGELARRPQRVVEDQPRGESVAAISSVPSRGCGRTSHHSAQSSRSAGRRLLEAERGVRADV